MSTEAQATRKYEPLSKPIYTAAQLVERMKEIADVAIVLSPFAGISEIPQGWRISERHVYAQVAEGDDGKGGRTLIGDLYKPFWAKGDTCAPTKLFILRIWMAAGGSILWSRRVDDRKDSRFVEWDAMLELRQLDTNVVKFPGNKRLDLREAADHNLTGDQLRQARKRITELAESEAILRGVRGVLALAQSYSIADLKSKPFVLYQAVPDYDMDDPIIKRMVAATQLGVVDRMFGPASPTPLLGTPQAAPLQITNGRGNGDQQTAVVNGELVNTQTGQVMEDASGFEPPPAQAQEPTIVCTCPCGDQMVVGPENARVSVAAVGTPRCPTCWPWNAKYDVKRHAELKNMEMPKIPTLTGEGAAVQHQAFLDAQKRKVAAGGAR